MALVIDHAIKVSKDCTTVSFLDKTNWGAPEIEANDASITDAFITIDLLDGSTPTIVNLFASGFPNDICTEYDITSEVGNSDTCFILTYTVVISAVENSSVKQHFTDCNTTKKVHQLLAKITIDDCECDFSIVGNANMAMIYLEAMKHAGCCGQKNRWTELKDFINKLVDFEINNCNNC